MNRGVVVAVAVADLVAVVGVVVVVVLVAAVPFQMQLLYRHLLLERVILFHGTTPEIMTKKQRKPKKIISFHCLYVVVVVVIIIIIVVSFSFNFAFYCFAFSSLCVFIVARRVKMNA